MAILKMGDTKDSLSNKFSLEPALYAILCLFTYETMLGLVVMFLGMTVTEGCFSTWFPSDPVMS